MFRTKYYSTYDKHASKHAPRGSTLLHDDKDTPNEWHVGPTGTGKSKACRARFPDFYDKDASNDWFEGFRGETTMLIDDVDKFHVKLGYYLKRWSDRYPFRANIKGTSINGVRFDRVLVTSNYRPEDIWKDSTTLDPIYRRFSIHTYALDGTVVVTRPGDSLHVPDEESPFTKFKMYQSYNL